MDLKWLITDKTPVSFTIASILFWINTTLLAIVFPTFVGLWADYQKVDIPTIDPYTITAWGFMDELLTALLIFITIAFIIDNLYDYVRRRWL